MKRLPRKILTPVQHKPTVTFGEAKAEAWSYLVEPKSRDVYVVVTQNGHTVAQVKIRVPR